ncbi:hypothetical protein Pcac1_g29419 [Phytophthora cactorum]|nr:hypothetical protein Pcac1_g29419 [Phytophthora cactorum]
MIGCRLGSEDSVSSDQSITFESSFYPSSVFAPVPPSATSLPPPHTSFVSKIHTFHQKVQKQFGKKVKFVRHDGAREFATNSLKDFYEDEGIEQQTTVPYAHQTNGTAERAIRTIVTIGRSMLHHAKLNKRFWAEAAMTAIYVKNRLPSPRSSTRLRSRSCTSPSRVWKHMRVFGCRTYILTPKEKRSKWDPKARAGVFLGYEEVSKAYRLYDIEAGQVVYQSRCQTSMSRPLDFHRRFLMKMSTTWTSKSLDIDNDGPARRSTRRQGSAKSRPSDEDEAARRPRAVRHRPGLEEASAPNYSSPHRADADEEKSMEMR